MINKEKNVKQKNYEKIVLLTLRSAISPSTAIRDKIAANTFLLFPTKEGTCRAKFYLSFTPILLERLVIFRRSGAG